VRLNWLLGVLRGGLSGGRLELGEQQARLLDQAEQVVLRERAVKLLRGELVFAIFERQHVPLLPEPAGPSSSNGFWSFAARKTTWVITGSMKYPVAASLAPRSLMESNIASSSRPRCNGHRVPSGNGTLTHRKGVQAGASLDPDIREGCGP